MSITSSKQTSFWNDDGLPKHVILKTKEYKPGQHASLVVEYDYMDNKIRYVVTTEDGCFRTWATRQLAENSYDTLF